MQCKFFNDIILFFIMLDPTQVFTSNLDECSICMDNDKQIIFYPCKHYHCCSQCSKLCNICPICRHSIYFKVHI